MARGFPATARLSCLFSLTDRGIAVSAWTSPCTDLVRPVLTGVKAEFPARSSPLAPLLVVMCTMISTTEKTTSSLTPRKAQYTPPTPTQLNCRVELRRRCVLNSQLVGDSFDESRRVWTNCRQRSRVASCRRCVRTSRQSWPSFQFSAPVTYRLQNCKLGHDSRRVCTHRRHKSTRQDKFSTCSVSKFSSAVVVS